MDDFRAISSQIMDNSLRLYGELGIAQAGIYMLPEKYKKGKGIIRVNHKYVNHIKAALALTKEVKGRKAIFRTLGVSGMINKAEKRYLSA